jgi:hypothetical protein
VWVEIVSIIIPLKLAKYSQMSYIQVQQILTRRSGGSKQAVRQQVCEGGGEVVDVDAGG